MALKVDEMFDLDISPKPMRIVRSVTYDEMKSDAVQGDTIQPKPKPN